MEVSSDNPNQWPFVEQQFSDGQVQSPVNIIPQNAYKVNLTKLSYHRYWSENSSVLIKIGNKGNARKSVSYFTKIICKNKFKTNEMIAYFFSSY